MLTAPQFSPDRLAGVLGRIEAAARRAGRDPTGVRLLAVSKQQPADRVRAAAAAGQREFGENYLQEALPKIAELDDLGLAWHYIGPYMGMMLALGILWIISELIHSDKDEAEKSILSVVTALKKIDSPSVLFFLGILLSVSALQQAGVLNSFAIWMDEYIGNTHAIVITIGLLSSILDNVPLVAAVQGMYPLTQFPADNNFWHFLAYCAGTGGSILIIGSAAGVAAMGMENISFTWYLRKISIWVLLGYLAGAFLFIFLN